MKWGPFFLAAFLLALRLHASDFGITLGANPTLLFTGQSQFIPLLITNAAGGAKASIDYRVFQLAAGVATTIAARAFWKEIPLQPGQTILDRLPLTLPEVKSPTAFAIKLFETGVAKEIATVMIVAYPADLLAQLKLLLKDHHLALFEEKGIFANAMTKAGLEFARVSNLSDPILVDKPIVLLTSASLPAEVVADLSKVVDTIVHVAPSGPPSLDRLPIDGYTKNQAFVVRCDPGLLEDFSTSPLAQINLIRALRFALRRGAHPEVY